MDDIFVRFIDFPCDVDGTTVIDDNNDYNIYINSRTSHVQQLETLRHELRHITHDHFHDGKPLDEDEKEAESAEHQDFDTSVLENVHWGGEVWARK